MKPRTYSRRAAFKAAGAVATGLAVFGTSSAQSSGSPAVGGRPPRNSNSTRKELYKRVFATPLIDTHEHLIEEKMRLSGPSGRLVPCDDWALLLSHYLNSDLLSAECRSRKWNSSSHRKSNHWKSGSCWSPTGRQ
jgi:hypothetical protein